MSFGVESLDPATLKKSGRRPIPQEHQREIIAHCRKLGIVTAGFYVLGFLQDTWDSIAATIDYSIDLGSTFAQFKILTPYPGTPMFKQLEPLLTETDWEKFDGYTPTFKHPNLTALRARVPARDGLQALLHAAVVSRELPEDPERVRPRLGQPDGSNASTNITHERKSPTSLARLHADGHLALRSASPSEHRRDRRGLQGPRRVHPRSPDRTVRSGIRPARRDGTAAGHHGLVRPHGVLLHPQGPRFPAPDRNRFSRADVLGDAGDCAGRRD